MFDPYSTVLVDCPNILHRGYYPNSTRVNREGIRVGIEYGFLRSLLTLARTCAPAKLILCWDGDSKRCLTLEPEYKANHTTSELKNSNKNWRSRIADLRSALTWVLPTYYHPDFEADEQIAVLAGYATINRERTLIASSDRDFHQLVSESVQILDGDKVIRTVASIEAKWGLPVSQIPYFRAIDGDDGDNLPGVARIRTKAKITLASYASSIDDLIALIESANVPETVSAKEKEKLLGSTARIRTNHAVMNLTSPTWDATPLSNTSNPDLGPILDLCERYGLDEIASLSEWNLFLPIERRVAVGV